jgi:hypothetical protein
VGDLADAYTPEKLFGFSILSGFLGQSLLV